MGLNINSNDENNLVIKDERKRQEKLISSILLNDVKIDNYNSEMFNLAMRVEVEVKDQNQLNLSVLRYFKNLEVLLISFVRENGIIDINGIEHCKKLRILEISNSNLSDLTPLKNLENLQTLSIFDNKIEDMSPLKDLTQLKEIYIDNNNITDISPIKNLVKLKYLYLSNNNISDISILKNINLLDRLELQHNKITDVSVLEHCNILTSLILENNKISNCDFLRSLDRLYYLNINNNPIKDLSSLNCSDSLQILKMDSTLVSNLMVLYRYKKLERISIQDTLVMDISVFVSIPTLTNINLSQTKVKDILAISSLEKIDLLDLRETEITDFSKLSTNTYLFYPCEKIVKGTFPNRWLSYDVLMSKFSKNEKLSAVNLSVLKEYLKKVKELNIDLRSVDNLSLLDYCESLEWLSFGFGNYDFCDADKITRLKTLKLFCIQYTTLNDISWIEKMTYLKYLLLLDNEQLEDITAIESLDQLEIISFARNGINDTKSLDKISNFGNLKDLNLVGNPLSNEDVEKYSVGNGATISFENDNWKVELYQ